MKESHASSVPPEIGASSNDEASSGIYVHELDYAEAAQVMHIPVGTVKSRLARARLKIIQKLRTSPGIVPAQAGCMEAI